MSITFEEFVNSRRSATRATNPVIVSAYDYLNLREPVIAADILNNHGYKGLDQAVHALQGYARKQGKFLASGRFNDERYVCLVENRQEVSITN